MSPREIIARCLASAGHDPDAEDYSLADDVLLALDNAGLVVTARVQFPSSGETPQETR